MRLPSPHQPIRTGGVSAVLRSSFRLALHRGSKETILSESRDVAKMKKDSMTAIFPLYCKNILQNKKARVASFLRLRAVFSFDLT